MYRGSRGPSKATPTTRCQKCLKLGHYTYECKAPTQERPYISRPSRTQQLFNPKLQPKLGEAVPPPETNLLVKKGVADAILKEKEELRERERGRKRRRNRTPSPPPSGRKRDRSSSVSSYSSYSSISSTRSPPPRSRYHGSRSKSRECSRRSKTRSGTRTPDRSVRRKYRDSPSPARRGRRLSPTDDNRRTRSRSPPRRLSGTHTRPQMLARDMDIDHPAPQPPRNPSPPRERSLSPFSRRQMLTQQMQRGI